MLKLKQLDTHSWEFVHPDGYNDTLDMLDEGCDFYEMGDFAEAEKIFRAVVDKMPDHLGKKRSLWAKRHSRRILKLIKSGWHGHF